MTTTQPTAPKFSNRDVTVLLYDGRIKRIEDVIAGDILMGDDSTPRTVLSTYCGFGDVYCVTPVKGGSYITGGDWELVLRRSSGPSIGWSKKENKYHVRWCDNNGIEHGQSFFARDYLSKEATREAAEAFKVQLGRNEIKIDISPRGYIDKSNSWQGNWKGCRTGVDFPQQQPQQQPPIGADPYLIGLWLGDGTSVRTQITTADEEIVTYLKEILPTMDMHLALENDGREIHYYMGGNKWRCNPLLNELRAHNLIKNKHIPHVYLTAPRQERLRLLAGLMDTDGSLSNGCYDFIQKSTRLSDDVVFLARSCGFSAYPEKCRKGCWYEGEYREDEYNRMNICGEVSEIPCLIERKKAGPRQQVKNVCNTGITVENIGKKLYHGFHLDGNRRFLLGDFTIVKAA